MKINSIAILSIALGTLSSCVTTSPRPRPVRAADRIEDKLDRREDRWDRRHGPNGPLDRLEDRRDRRENRFDRANIRY